MKQGLKRVLGSILLLVGFVSSVAGAATLECGTRPFEKFTVDLDTKSFRQKEGSLLFWPSNGSIRMGYAAAERMACAGLTLGDLHCVGFWFGLPDHVAQIRLRKTADGFVAFYNWPGKTEIDGSISPCTVK